jgi:hypothetical protein
MSLGDTVEGELKAQETLRLYRSAYRTHSKDNTGVTYEDNFWKVYIRLYIDLLPDVCVDEFKKILEKLYLVEPRSREQIVKVGKALNLHAMTYRQSFSLYWKYYLSLTSGLPWVEITKEGVEDLLDRVIRDFTDDPVTNTSEEYLKDFRRYTKKWFLSGNKVVKSKLSVDEFLDNPSNYVTPGASVDSPKKGVFKLNGREFKPRKTKYGFSLSHDEMEVRRLFWDAGKIDVRMSIKGKEDVKLRTISKVGMPSHLRESYLLSYVLEARQGSWDTTYGSPITSTTAEIVKMQEGWVVDLNTMVGLATDAEAFDVNYIPGEEIAFWEALREVALELNWPYEYIEVLDVHLLSIKRGYEITINLPHIGSTTFEPTKGLISGTKSTSIRGTAKVSAVANMALDRAGVRDQCKSLLTNGDDQQMIFLTRKAALLFVKALKEINGMVINEGKTMESFGQFGVKNLEFLKKVTTPDPVEIDGVIGYNVSGLPFRSLKSVLLRSPESSETRASPQSIFSNWMRMITRGLPAKKVLPHCISDISSFMRVSKRDVEDWLYTPRTLGGAGLVGKVPDRFVKLSLSVEFVDKKLTVTTRSAWKKYRLSDKIITTAFLENLGILPVQKKSRTIVQGVRMLLFSQLPTKETNYRVVPSEDVGGMYTLLLSRARDLKLGLDGYLELIDDSQHELCKYLWEKWSRNVFFDWLDGKLFVNPFSYYVGSQQMSTLAEPVKKRMFTYLKERRASRAMLNMVNVFIEHYCVKDARVQPVRLGD